MVFGDTAGGTRVLLLTPVSLLLLVGVVVCLGDEGGVACLLTVAFCVVAVGEADSCRSRLGDVLGETVLLRPGDVGFFIFSRQEDGV